MMGMKEKNKTTSEKRPVLQKLSEIPELPGIYQMLDSRGNIIYIGKSKCLKKRVHSYFTESPRWEKARKMAPFIYDINYIVTDTHLEAMLLECEMIKSEKPYFNAVMKNDERYVYLTVSDQKKGKLLTATYTREEVSFGPFRSRSRLQEFIDSMENLYPLTEKRKKYQFDYHIFPKKLTEEERSETSRLLKKLLSEPDVVQMFMDLLEKKMKKAAREEKFETALKYRDLQEQLRYVRKNLREYGEWMNRQLIYMEETGKGKKYFFIDNGLVIHKAIREAPEVKKAEGREQDEKEVEGKTGQCEEIWLKKFTEDAREILQRQENPGMFYFTEKESRGQSPCIQNSCIQGSFVRESFMKGALTEKQKVDFQDIVFSECGRAGKNVRYLL